jgi:hypothetical protein
LYTKSGDIGISAATLALLPDYDVGFTVLAAGHYSTANVQIISDMLAAIFVPTLEATARQEAEWVYGSTYSSPGATKSNLTIVTNMNPGVSITENSIEALPLIGTLLGASAAQLVAAGDGLGVSIQLYSTGLRSSDGLKSHGTPSMSYCRKPSIRAPSRRTVGAGSISTVSLWRGAVG